MSGCNCGNKPICCICKMTQEILAIVKKLKCECDLTPVLDAISELQNDINELQEQFDCKKDDCNCDDEDTEDGGSPIIPPIV